MSYPIDDAEQLIANAEAEMPPSTRSRLIAKLRMGKHIDEAAAELDVSPAQIFSTGRILTAFGDKLKSVGLPIPSRLLGGDPIRQVRAR